MYMDTRQSLLYDEGGKITTIPDRTIDGRPIFRKQTNCLAEIIIMKEIILAKSPVLLQIYAIQDQARPWYYDAELLDVACTNFKNKHRDIRECLGKLHQLGIAYVDLKHGNMGFSMIDKRWKLFDYDSSGLYSIKAQSWIYEPPKYWNYRFGLKLKYGLKVDNVYDINLTPPKKKPFPRYKYKDFKEVDLILYKHLFPLRQRIFSYLCMKS